ELLEIYKKPDQKDTINLKKKELKEIKNTLVGDWRCKYIVQILSDMMSDGKLHNVNKMIKTLKTLLKNLLEKLSVGDEKKVKKIVNEEAENIEVEADENGSNEIKVKKIVSEEAENIEVEADENGSNEIKVKKIVNEEAENIEVVVDKSKSDKNKGDKSLEEILMPIILLKIKAEKDNDVSDTGGNNIWHKIVQFSFKPKVENKVNVSIINKMVEILFKLIRGAENNEKEVRLYIKNLESISEFIDNLPNSENKVKSIKKLLHNLHNSSEDLNIVANILGVLSGITNKTKSDDKKINIISSIPDMLTKIVMKKIIYKEGMEKNENMEANLEKVSEKDLEVVSSIIEIFSKVISNNYNAIITKKIKEPETLFEIIRRAYDDIDSAKNFTDEKDVKRIVLEIIELMIKSMIKNDTYTEYKASQDKMNKLNVIDAKIRAILSEVKEDKNLDHHLNELDYLKTQLTCIKDDAIMDKYFKDKIDILQKIHSKKINWFKKFLLYFLTIMFLPTLFLTGLISLKNEDKEYAEFKYYFKDYKEKEPYEYNKIKWRLLWFRLRNEYRVQLNRIEMNKKEKEIIKRLLFGLSMDSSNFV
ncbi:10097_t:CDS:1, partial [Dentiscutata heterogama]